MSARAACLACLLAALAAPTASFMAPLSVGHPAAAGLRQAAAVASPATVGPQLPLRRAVLPLRMADAPSTEGAAEEEKEVEEEVIDSTLSDDDLTARIAELGLGGEGGVEDKSSGESADADLRPIERAQKQAAAIGAAAIGGAANAAITALNAIEQPIAEEEWKKRKEEEDKEPAPKTGERTMISEGGLVVVAPVLFLGVAFALW